MRRLLPLPVVFALLFVPLQSLSGTVYACSCIETTVEERVQSSDVVAVGTVLSVYEDQTAGSGDGMFADVDGLVRVSTYYKGSGPSEIAVDDPPSGGTCGVIGSDSVGPEAVLFLELSGGEYGTSLCAGTQFYGDDGVSAQVIAGIEAVTGPGVAPEGPPPQDEPAEHAEGTPWEIVLPLAFAIPLAVLFVPAFVRRRGGR